MVGTLPWLLLSQQPITHQPFVPCHDNIIAFEQTSQLQITQYEMLQMENPGIQHSLMQETKKLFRCHSYLVICKLRRQHARDIHWIVWRPKSRCLGATRQRAATCNALWGCCCHRCVRGCWLLLLLLLMVMSVKVMPVLSMRLCSIIICTCPALECSCLCQQELGHCCLGEGAIWEGERSSSLKISPWLLVQRPACWI